MLQKQQAQSTTELADTLKRSLWNFLYLQGLC